MNKNEKGQTIFILITNFCLKQINENEIDIKKREREMKRIRRKLEWCHFFVNRKKIGQTARCTID